MAERPRRSIVTTSSALSSSSEDRMRASNWSLFSAVSAAVATGPAAGEASFDRVVSSGQRADRPRRKGITNVASHGVFSMPRSPAGPRIRPIPRGQIATDPLMIRETAQDPCFGRQGVVNKGHAWICLFRHSRPRAPAAALLRRDALRDRSGLKPPCGLARACSVRLSIRITAESHSHDEYHSRCSAHAL